MSLSQQVQPTANGEMSGILEKLILENNLAGLTSIQKVSYITNMCESLGLNPTTQPIKLLKFQGKEIPYFTKDATEQLRKINNVSIVGIDSKIINDLYIVTSNAQMPNGRTDSSTGVISIKGLNGENLCNAMLKAETKSKRRVTLSICGLGFLDESEIESMKIAEKESRNNVRALHTGRRVDHEAYQDKHEKLVEKTSVETVPQETDDQSIEFPNFMNAIEMSEDLTQLQCVFGEIKKMNFKETPELFKKLIDAKDKRKAELTAASIIQPEEIDTYGDVS